MGNSGLLAFFEFLHLVRFHLQHPPAPEIGLRAHLLAKVVQELVWLWQLVPNLG